MVMKAEPVPSGSAGGTSFAPLSTVAKFCAKAAGATSATRKRASAKRFMMSLLIFGEKDCITGRARVVQARAVTARLIDGKAIAQKTEAEVAAAIARLDFKPGLVAVRVGNDPASEIYVRNKARKARELGLQGTELVFPDSLSEAELLEEVERLNRDPDVDGILVQLPLPKQIDPRKV